MIKEYIEAWNENKFNFELWLKHDVNADMIDYPDIVKGLIDTVINPYIEDTYDTLNVSRMTVIDDGEYQGTNIFIIPYDRYQPTESEYVITHNYYGSCSGCDALMACQGWGKEVEERTIKGIMSIALHLLERMKPLYEMEGEDE